MPDRIDELVAAIDANTLLQWDGKDVALEAAHELATIARKAEADYRDLQGTYDDLAVDYKQLRAEADKWRKVAEEVAKMAADLSDEFVGAGVGPGEFIDEAVRRILIEQEEAE